MNSHGVWRPFSLTCLITDYLKDVITAFYLRQGGQSVAFVSLSVNRITAKTVDEF